MYASLLAAVVASVVSTSGPSLDDVFGIRLPPWDATPADVDRMFPEATDYRPPRCGNELPAAPNTRRYLRLPDVAVAGIQVQYLEFAFAEGTLEFISFDLASREVRPNAAVLRAYLEKNMGPPTSAVPRIVSVWVRRTTVVVALGPRVTVMPRTPAAEAHAARVEEMFRSLSRRHEPRAADHSTQQSGPPSP